MINFNYNTNLYLCFSNYFGLKIYFLIPKCYFQSLIWNGHMFSIYIHIFNAHHSSWYSSSTDTRGTMLESMVSGSNVGILNWDSATRLP